MDSEQKERLEQELRFLKESLEAEVISKEEYEKGRERIERKIKELGGKPEEKEEIEIKEIKEKPTKIIGMEGKEPEETKEEAEEPKTEDLSTKEPEEEEKEEEPKTEDLSTKEQEEITISKKWLYGITILILALILFFAIRGCYKPTENQTPLEEVQEEFTPECSLDSDCEQEGMVGTCLNPGEKEAKCEFKEDVKTELTVINDKDCGLCDSSRMKNVIKEVFPNANINELDFKTEEAKKLVDALDIESLPAYIFDSEVSKTINFEDFKRALIKKSNNYIVTNTASGSNYYFKRKKTENTLDIFLTADTEEKIDQNIKEFLDLFSNNINFTKHLVTSDKEKAELSTELGITSYPVFLINNQFKFGGIHSSDSIKEKFCEVNELKGCKNELSKDIK